MVLLHHKNRRKVNDRTPTVLSSSSIHRLGSVFDLRFVFLGAWAVHVARMGEMKYVYRFSVRKTEVKRQLG